MSHTDPTPTAPIESKVKAATAGAIVSAAAVWALDEYVFTADTLPGPVEALVVLAVTGLVTFVSGWAARHTPRPDLPSAQR